MSYLCHFQFNYLVYTVLFIWSNSWSWMLWRLSVMMSDSYSMYAKPWDPQYQRRTEQSERNEIKSKHEWFMAQFRYNLVAAVGSAMRIDGFWLNQSHIVCKAFVLLFTFCKALHLCNAKGAFNVSWPSGAVTCTYNLLARQLTSYLKAL